MQEINKNYSLKRIELYLYCFEYDCAHIIRLQKSDK